jgi:hypothetical protein
MKKYIGPILSIATISMLFYTLFDLKEQVKQIPQLRQQLDSTQVVADSLYQELFNANVIVGRYETTLDWYKTEHPKEAKKFEDWLSHNTE